MPVKTTRRCWIPMFTIGKLVAGGGSSVIEVVTSTLRVLLTVTPRWVSGWWQHHSFVRVFQYHLLLDSYPAGGRCFGRSTSGLSLHRFLSFSWWSDGCCCRGRLIVKYISTAPPTTAHSSHSSNSTTENPQFSLPSIFPTIDMFSVWTAAEMELLVRLDSSLDPPASKNILHR